jgi:hypothetical protein
MQRGEYLIALWNGVQQLAVRRSRADKEDARIGRQIGTKALLQDRIFGHRAKLSMSTSGE